MGCDIHCRFERRNPDGTWESVLNTKPTEDDKMRHGWECEDARARHVQAVQDSGLLPLRPVGQRTKQRRHHPHRPNRPGRPPDASVEYRRLVEKWGVDGHSHTWVTLEELFDQRWHTREFTGESVRKDANNRTTYLSLARRLLDLAWDVLMEEKVHPQDMRLVMFLDN